MLSSRSYLKLKIVLQIVGNNLIDGTEEIKNFFARLLNLK